MLAAGVVGIPAQGIVRSFVTARMEELPESEVKDIARMVQEQKVEADSFSRELSDSENERMRELWHSYTAGMFPEKTLRLAEREEEMPEGVLSYAIETGYFNLPEREMTDEELLQIIDFNEVRNYALAQSPAGQEARREYLKKQERLQEQVEAEGGVSAEEAVKTAAAQMESQLGAQAEGVKYSQVCLMDISEEDYAHKSGVAYEVVLRSAVGGPLYVCRIDSGDGSILEAGVNLPHSKAAEPGQVTSGGADSFPEDILKAVLLGDVSFSYCSEGQAETMDITGVPALFDADDPMMKIFDFSIADLDRDGGDEVILFVVGAAGDAGGKVILHEADNGVYGYKTDNRTLVDLKADGTYSYSDPTGMTEAGIAAVSGFSGGGFTEEKIAYAAGTYEGWDTFTAGGKDVAEEDYMDMVSAQEEKQDAERYDFSAENIEAVF